MKFALVSVFLALAIVSVQAQFFPPSGFFPSLRRSSLFRNRFEATTAAPQGGGLSDQVTSALLSLEGNSMLKNTINAFGKAMDSLGNDLQNLKDGKTKIDFSGLTQAEAQEAMRILKSIPDNYQSFVDLVTDIRSGNIKSIMDLPGYFMETNPMIKNMFALSRAMIQVSRYISPSSLLPNTFEPLMEVPPAVIRDIISNSCAMTRFVMREIVSSAMRGFM